MDKSHLKVLQWLWKPNLLRLCHYTLMFPLTIKLSNVVLNWVENGGELHLCLYHCRLHSLLFVPNNCIVQNIYCLNNSKFVKKNLGRSFAKRFSIQTNKWKLNLWGKHTGWKTGNWLLCYLLGGFHASQPLLKIHKRVVDIQSFFFG